MTAACQLAHAAVAVATAKRHGARPPKLPPLGNDRSTWLVRYDKWKLLLPL